MSEHDTDPNRPKEELPPGVELRPHVFDGIEEYDQKLPNWWLWTFYGAIILFVVLWFGYYQMGKGMSDEERIKAHQMMVAGEAGRGAGGDVLHRPRRHALENEPERGVHRQRQEYLRDEMLCLPWQGFVGEGRERQQAGRPALERQGVEVRRRPAAADERLQYREERLAGQSGGHAGLGCRSRSERRGGCGGLRAQPPRGAGCWRHSPPAPAPATP